MEIGSGIGSNAEVLSSSQNSYLGVEPDSKLVHIASKRFPEILFKQGTSRSCEEIEKASAIFYLDVLEHIEDDKEELKYVCSRMKNGAFLVILVPAHQFLFSNFDFYVGHWRRYSIPMLQESLPQTMRVVRMEHLDSIGFVLSFLSNKLLNGKFLNQKSIKLWDALVPISRQIDRVFHHRLGKSVLMIAQKKI